MEKEQLEKYEKEIEKVYPDSFVSEDEQNIIDPNYKK